MNGWCKFTFENERSVTINYSLEDNQDCDGKLTFNKDNQEIKISKLSRGATAKQTNNFICSVRGRIRRGFDMNKLYYLAIG